MTGRFKIRLPRLRRPWLAAVALVVVGSLVLAACGGSSKKTKTTAAAPSAKTYVVATSADFPPMSFRSATNTSQVVGFEVDMMNAISKHLGWHYKLVTSDFNGLIPSVESGRVDMVVSDVYHTAARAKVVDFIDYLRNSFAVMVAGSNGSKTHSYANICGHSMAVLTGSAPELMIAQTQSSACTKAGKPAIAIKSFPSVAQELPSLANGSLYSILEEWSSLSYIQKQNHNKYVVAFPDPNTTNVGIVLRKGSPLKSQLESGVRWFLSQPAYAQTAKKWGIQTRSLLKA
jgi:polar amino acid transport system substrate-binding protein